MANARTETTKPPYGGFRVVTYLSKDGSPGWIRTTECLSQSQVPYRLATGVRMQRIVTPAARTGATKPLTLRELGGAACLVQADLLALDFARIAVMKPALRSSPFRVSSYSTSARAMPRADRAGLAGGAARRWW